MPLRWFKRAPAAEQINDHDWVRATAALPLIATLPESARTRLRGLSEQFLTEKTITGARGFEVTPLVSAAIAVQACLPVLALGLAGYSDFVEIVVYPAQFKVPRRNTDEAGVVHETQDWLAGEAMSGGPIVLSWEDIAPDREDSGANVVIHEFVHKLDMLDGEADGVPPMPMALRARWEATLQAAYDDFCDRLDALERDIPADVDPESAEADDWYLSLPLDPYAATDPAEFFAVSAEQFFIDPAALQQGFPEWFDLLCGFFRQTPQPHLDAAPRHS
jgi:hypothetical protein